MQWALCTPSGVPAGLHAASSLGSEHTVLSVLFPLALVATGESECRRCLEAVRIGLVGMALHQWSSACPEQQWVYNPGQTSFSQAGACVGGVFYYFSHFFGLLAGCYLNFFFSQTESPYTVQASPELSIFV